ncbi:MAG: SAF domain-containing protein [Candidatus Dormibacteraceae bacterium]
MSTVTEPRRLRVVARTVERRWRLAALIGLALTLVLAAYAVIALGPGADANQMVSVLRAAKTIYAGTTITADDLSTDRLRTDPGTLATLLRDSDRARIVGQVAAEDVAAGDLIPSSVVSSQSTAGLWKVNLPIREMPADLAAGNHVALLVSVTAAGGSQADIVYLQDVRVLSVGQGSAELWIPANLFPQVIWFADHGGIVLATMQPGAVQNKIPAGGAS